MKSETDANWKLESLGRGRVSSGVATSKVNSAMNKRTKRRRSTRTPTSAAYRTIHLRLCL
eukprot:2613753-Pleurochrysis_carterae.AAC.1